MKNIQLLLLIIISSSCNQTPDVERIKLNYILDDQLYFEKIAFENNNPNRYTDDNKIYTINRKFIYDYYIIKQKDSFKIASPKYAEFDADYQREWEFIPKSSSHENKIETISISVLPGVSNTNQTLVKYEYQYMPDLGRSYFSSTSGVIENEMNTWIHPHRDKYFMILELNPFPFIQEPFEIGNSWNWNLNIGDYWQDQRWKLWTGSITNNYQYNIIGKEKIITKIGELECFVIESVASSEIGSTGLIAYFNEEFGFVKLDYINIDKSRLTIELKEITAANNSYK